MHFQSTLVALTLALTAAAMPNPSSSAGRIAPAIPAASPTPTPAMAPTPSASPDYRDWPKFQSDPQSQGQGHNQDQDKGKCPDLCSLMAEACTIAVPNDEAFW